jgi:hypothetical protein
MTIAHTLPELEEHEGIIVARDTLIGGTKSRYLWQLYLKHHEVVYASSAEGTAQVALAATAQRWSKRAIIFGPARATLHLRQLEAIKLGADFHPVKPGYLNVCQAKARDYAAKRGAYLLPFGAKLPHASQVIAQTALALKIKPSMLWCASGSGTLISGLRKAWPSAIANVTEVGHQLTDEEAAGANIYRYHKPYSFEVPSNLCPFDTDGTYERKAWIMLREWKAENRFRGKILFWSVMSAPQGH